MSRVARFDALPTQAARQQLAHACGAERWVEAMLARRPFGDEARLFQAADASFATLGREDWLEAFRHHPQIGDLQSLRQRFAATAHLAAGEQAGVRGAGEATLAALAAGNAEYEARFGFIFIVCATGKTADEMLDLLRSRLPHALEIEIEIAAGEQRKITRLRLEKGLEAPPSAGAPGAKTDKKEGQR